MHLRRRALVVGLALAVTPLLGGTAYAADLPAPTATAPVTGTASKTGQPTLTAVRTGRHDRYDRTVFDFAGGTPGYRVEYGTLVGQGRGDVIPLAGAATLVVVFSGVGVPAVNLGKVYNPRYPTLRQIKSGGYFEGYASFGLGVQDRVGFRVLTLHNPDRIAIDVAHQPTQRFGTAPYFHEGHAPEALVEHVRVGRHPGYDRVVLDLQGAQQSRLDVRYRGPGSTIRVTLTGSGSATVSPHGSYAGPQSYRFGLPALRTLSFTVVGAGILTADIGTAARHGFRVLLLQNPTRVAIDVAR